MDPFGAYLVVFCNLKNVEMLAYFIQWENASQGFHTTKNRILFKAVQVKGCFLKGKSMGRK